MRKSKNILRILILFISIVVIYNIKSYCTVNGTKRMEITGGDPWVNINVSDAYAECESLNSTTSALGTNNLRAHLTTDADWSAMAIFSISQYGAATTNTPESTTGNESGIYNPGRNNTFTTGILDTLTISNANSYVKDLFNVDGSLKYNNYIRKWSITRTNNNVVWFNNKDGTDENGLGTYGWFNSWKFWGNSVACPVSIRKGLFGVEIGGTASGYGFAYGSQGVGRPRSYFPSSNLELI